MYLALKRMLTAGTLTRARVTAALSTGLITQAQADDLRSRLLPDPEPEPQVPAEGTVAMATVADDDPLTITIAGKAWPARRLQAYTPEVGDDVKATWLDSGWVVEDAIATDAAAA